MNGARRHADARKTVAFLELSSFGICDARILDKCRIYSHAGTMCNKKAKQSTAHFHMGGNCAF
jgi:hypothetical protein